LVTVLVLTIFPPPPHLRIKVGVGGGGGEANMPQVFDSLAVLVQDAQGCNYNQQTCTMEFVGVMPQPTFLFVLWRLQEVGDRQ
jgi:hypothetical protein